MDIPVPEAPAESDKPSTFVRLTPAVAIDKIKDNIRSAIARGLPLATVCKPHSMSLSVAAGGPSLAQSYLYLSGAVAAVNGSLAWLRGHGVKPHFCGICDAGPHIADMIEVDLGVRYYVASSCDPAVFDKLAGCDVRLWHLTPDSTEDPEGVKAIYDAAYPEHWHAIGGGCTMGLRWINLGRFLGFRRFNLHGLDSSFVDGATHAYPDRADAKEHIAFNGHQTRPNFLAQLYDFFGTLNQIQDDDPTIEVEVFGAGLLPDEWTRWLLENEPLAFTRYREPAEYAFPAGDEHGKVRLAECRFLMAHLLPFLVRRGVAVQAGGNVGVLPNMLSYHFGAVHSFEPEPVNYGCLRRNMRPHCLGITTYPFALGAKDGLQVGLALQDDNRGATYIEGPGDIAMRTIDGLGLDACDLICLDIEGYELAALYGAASTIARFAPVICIEEKGLCERYSVPRTAVRQWLAERGYELVGTCGHDLIYTRSAP